jgi:hypothetical protein
MPNGIGGYISSERINREAIREIQDARRLRETPLDAALRLGWEPCGTDTGIPAAILKRFHAVMLTREGYFITLKQREGAFEKVVHYVKVFSRTFTRGENR